MCWIFSKKKKTTKYHYSMFFENNDDAVREFFHYAKDHYLAAKLLRESGYIPFLDSVGYLYHLAIELLLKGLSLYHFEEIKKTHELVKLYKKLKNSAGFDELSEDDINLLRVLNQFQYLKYPVDKSSRNVEMQWQGEVGSSMRGEVGDEELDGANELFVKLWTYLESQPPLKEIINGIDWTRKGGRVLMRKRIEGE